MLSLLHSQSIVTLFGFLITTAFASGLEWERKEASLTASPRQEKIEHSFHFKNSGSAPITIKSAKSSCDCTVADLSKMIYAPGEGGELKVIYKIEGKVGKKERTITVETDEPGAPTVLTLKVDIPELVEVKPRLLVWQKGESNVEKPIDVFMATEPPISLTNVVSSDPDVSVRIEPIAPSREYRIWIKPHSTEVARRAVIHVTAKATDLDQDYHFNIYVQIR